jgi:hypothetical protein
MHHYQHEWPPAMKRNKEFSARKEEDAKEERLDAEEAKDA